MLAALLAALPFALLASAAPDCAPLDAAAPTVLVTVAADSGLADAVPAVERAARGTTNTWVDPTTTRAILVREGGHEGRAAALLDARSLVARAEERFRELETEEALQIIAEATSKLAAIHAQPGAVEVLAHAHFLAGAIYVARDRVDAARRRLLRALDLNPSIAPPRHRYNPRVLAELEAARAALREVGRLEVRLVGTPQASSATVFLDGRERGGTPLILDAVGAGRHLVRVVAPGHSSWVRTIAVDPGRDVELDVRLTRDPELVRIDRLAEDLRVQADVHDTLALLARRAQVAQSVVLFVHLADRRSAVGTATVSVDVRTSGGGYARAPTVDAVPEAIAAATRCAEGPAPVFGPAPIIIGTQPVRTAPGRPLTAPPPFWTKPWFWAVCAFVAIGVSGGLVATRASGGPPESVEVTLVPRP
ncbi:MAG: PEGA domain-containing protein [Deltaproteobacteria bacterium]